jgi:uncharacterized peroxidase-related enzyme
MPGAGREAVLLWPASHRSLSHIEEKEKKHMSRLNPIDPQAASGKTRELLGAVEKALGLTPNMMRVMANSPAVLEAYLNFSGALSRGRLSARLREQLALAVAQANACDYCLSAHTALGKLAGLNEAEISASRQSQAGDDKTAAALRFARRIVESRGELSDAEVSAVRQAGYEDAEIAELIANVSLNIFTNYFNHIAGTVIDFPKVTAATGSL